ncbi:MAG TPA: transcriptional regulator [Clostridia bacterium]|nr:transcriptional regulator [Clostridia bacterium]
MLRVFVVAILLLLSPSANAQWVPVGPEGGDVRSLAYDPRNPDRILLGTSAGQLFLSTDTGASWARFAHLGPGDAYVLDNIAVDPNDANTIYVAAWSVEAENDGDLFRTRDGGRTWQVIPAMRGKSIRAMALAQTNARIITIGALDGVFRSTDGGDTWQRISPEGHAEIKNIESVAVDPRNPQIVYAGTWHLPWKTEDGGRTWHNIKQGVVDDSDVFSIIIDHSNPAVVYASACSGIYKSESAGDLFRKVQGIPATARRTRVLQQDPVTAAVVYAGTTEGLWKTVDGGKTFKRITAGNHIINDVMVDPRNASRLLIATDRSGVLASDDAGQTFRMVNTGFSHRQVSRMVVDRTDRSTVFAAVVNDKEFGGVFVSRNAGAKWTQVSDGLAGRDVFDISQAKDGTLVGATNRGIFSLVPNSTTWKPINTILNQKPAVGGKPRRTKSGKLIAPPAAKPQWTKSELSARVAQVDARGIRWFAATNAGLFVSRDEGRSWNGGAAAGEKVFIGVRALGDTVLAATPTRLLISQDGGSTWAASHVPGYVTRIYGVAIAGALAPGNSTMWLATREGALRSTDHGRTWVHVLEGLPARNVVGIETDAGSGRMLATALGARGIYESRDAGRTWTATSDLGLSIRSVIDFNGRLLAATAYNGLLLQPATKVSPGDNVERPATGGAAQ